MENQKEFQKFNEIKDQILLNSNFADLKIPCKGCQSYNHETFDCSATHFAKDPTFICSSQITYQKQDRSKYSKRLKRKNFNSRKHQLFVHEKAYHFAIDYGFLNIFNEIVDDDEDEYYNTNIDAFGPQIQTVEYISKPANQNNYITMLSKQKYSSQEETKYETFQCKNEDKIYEHSKSFKNNEEKQQDSYREINKEDHYFHQEYIGVIYFIKHILSVNYFSCHEQKVFILFYQINHKNNKQQDKSISPIKQSNFFDDDFKDKMLPSSVKKIKSNLELDQQEQTDFVNKQKSMKQTKRCSIDQDLQINKSLKCIDSSIRNEIIARNLSNGLYEMVIQYLNKDIPTFKKIPKSQQLIQLKSNKSKFIQVESKLNGSFTQLNIVEEVIVRRNQNKQKTIINQIRQQRNHHSQSSSINVQNKHKLGEYVYQDIEKQNENIFLFDMDTFFSYENYFPQNNINQVLKNFTINQNKRIKKSSKVLKKRAILISKRKKTISNSINYQQALDNLINPYIMSNI